MGWVEALQLGSSLCSSERAGKENKDPVNLVFSGFHPQVGIELKVLIQCMPVAKLDFSIILTKFNFD